MADLDDILNSALDEVADEPEYSSAPAPKATPLSASAASPAASSSPSLPSSSSKTTAATSSSTSSKSELAQAAKATAAAQESSAKEALKKAQEDPGGDISDLLGKLLSGEGGDVDFGKLFDDALKDLESMGGPEFKAMMEQLAAGDRPGVAERDKTGDNASNLSEQEQLAQLMRMLQQAEAGSGAAGGSGGDGPPVPQTPEAFERMVREIEQRMSDEGMDKMMEGFMKRMVSKEVMLEPVVRLTEAYPAYLSREGNKLSGEDRVRYERQLACYRGLREAYETAPDDFERIQKIFNELQNYGPPPEEIQKQVVPPGAPPGFPGAGGPEMPPGCPQQ